MTGRPRLPFAPRGARIGLYGGTFNPPHAGHLHVANAALRGLGLTRLWWMISPGNPLKSLAPPPVETRAALARALVRNPRLIVTGVEAEIGARFTIETLVFLKRHRPDVRFVYVMGADSFATLQRWRDWRAIMALVPIVVVDRPGASLAALTSVAARRFAGARVGSGQQRRLAMLPSPAWVFLQGRRSSLSSTQLRQKAITGG